MAGNAPLKAKLVSRRGITFKYDVVTSSDITGEPLDTDGYVARMQIRDGYGGDLIADLNTANGGTVFPGLGICRIFISATDTEAMTVGSYRYDLEIEDAGGEVTQLIYGSYQVKDSVTE